MSEKNYDHLWENEKNWGGGFCGWYFCKEDPRLWVPKKVKAMGITINLGHPKGGSTLVGLFLLPTFLLLFIMIISIGISISVCGTNM